MAMISPPVRSPLTFDATNLSIAGFIAALKRAIHRLRMKLAGVRAVGIEEQPTGGAVATAEQAEGFDLELVELSVE